MLRRETGNPRGHRAHSRSGCQEGLPAHYRGERGQQPEGASACFLLGFRVLSAEMSVLKAGGAVGSLSASHPQPAPPPAQDICSSPSLPEQGPRPRGRTQEAPGAQLGRAVCPRPSHCRFSGSSRVWTRKAAASALCSPSKASRRGAEQAPPSRMCPWRGEAGRTQ